MKIPLSTYRIENVTLKEPITMREAKHGGFVITVDSYGGGVSEVLYAGDLDACLAFLKFRYAVNEAQSQNQEGPVRTLWVEWRGGENPCAGGTEVEVERKSGSFATNWAYEFDWTHQNKPKDIIRYRVIHS